MTVCPRCGKVVYFAERKHALGQDWHTACFKCEKCNKTLQPGKFSEHDGKPYCTLPCYGVLFGPKGCGRGGVESYAFNKQTTEAEPAPAPPAEQPQQE